LLRDCYRVGCAGPRGPLLVPSLYEKLAVRYEATVHIAAINEWLQP
jgi:hypothetical protein